MDIKKKSSLFSIFLITMISQADVANLSAQACEEDKFPPRLALRHLESKGVGYKKGYTTFEGFFAPICTDCPYTPFVDLRAHIFDDGKPAANIGLGVRQIESRVSGANIFYDYRRGERQGYHQISMGVESLGIDWDFRANGYLPISSTKSHLFHTRFHAFEGNNVIISRRREIAMKGGNAECGRHFECVYGLDLYAATGLYYFEASGKNTWGGEARFQAKVYDRLALQVNASYDSIFKTNIQGTLSLSFSFGHSCSNISKPCLCEPTLWNRVYQPVDRKEIIVLDKKKQKNIAIDPLTKVPIVVLFVDNTSHSLGTFESPYPTLAEASLNSSPNDVIYVFPGDGTDNGMDDGMNLKDNQRLLGAGIPHEMRTTYGSIKIPAFAGSLPQISNRAVVSQNVINLANNNEVSGFYIHEMQNMGGIAGGSGAGGSGTDINKALITNNRIVTSAGGHGVFLDGNANLGSVTISNCDFLASDATYAVGMTISDSYNAVLKVNSNIFSGVDPASGFNRGLEIFSLNDSVAEITNNAFVSQINSGINAFSLVIVQLSPDAFLKVGLDTNLFILPLSIPNQVAAMTAFTGTFAGSFCISLRNNAAFTAPGIPGYTFFNSAPQSDYHLSFNSSNLGVMEITGNPVTYTDSCD